MQTLNVKLCAAFDGGPLAVVDGIAGTTGAELRPAQLRALAAALQRIAADAEAHRGKGKRTPAPMQRSYPLQAA